VSARALLHLGRACCERGRRDHPLRLAAAEPAG